MKSLKRMSSKSKTHLLMIIPVVVLFFAFNTLPLIIGAFYSFTNYRGYGSWDFVGLRNYIDLFSDTRVWNSYLFTFKYARAGTVLVNVISLLMALALNSKIRFKSALRGVYFIPNILGGLIVGYIFSFIFTYIIPTVGESLNIEWIKNSILADERFAWIGILVVGVWQAVAMNTIIYISGLQTIPADVYEAAEIDGASVWKTYWKVIFPMMKPMHATVAVLTALGTWNDVMTPLVIMSGSENTTLPLAQLNFQTQFGTNYNLAFASYLLSLIPILIFYIICQKQIIGGVANGAVKG